MAHPISRRELVSRLAQCGSAGFLSRALPLGIGAAVIGWPRTARASTVLDPNDISNFTVVGQLPATGTVLRFVDADPQGVSHLFAFDSDATSGIDLDLITTFQVTPQTPNSIDAGFQVVINDGPSGRAAVAACILIDGLPHIGLVGPGDRSFLTTYPAYVQAEWQAAPLAIKLRRTAAGGAQLLEVNGVPPNPIVELLPDTLAGRTRDGTTVELGCYSGPATLQAEISEFRTETPNIAFSLFRARADIALWAGMDDDAFDVQALFTPGFSSNGFNVLTEDVTLTLGPQSWTIPAGSFRQFRNLWKFDGFVDTTWIAAVFTRLTGGRWGFAAVGTRAELDGITNPVRVGLQIGDDAGSTEVLARIVTP